MRPSILPNLIDAAQRNEARGLADPALFEVGPQYKDATPTGQRTVAAGLRHNMAVPRNWAGPARTVDAFDAKADALAVLAAIGAPVDNLSAAAGRARLVSPRPLGRAQARRPRDGVFRRAASRDRRRPPTSRARSRPSRCSSTRRRCPRRRRARRGRKLVLSPFQPLERDFAFLVDAGVEADKLVRAARNADKALITGARVFDVYAGKGVPEGKKSLAIAVTLQPVERTLTDAEIEAVSSQDRGAGREGDRRRACVVKISLSS